jgi:hypothetical protein
LLVSFSLRITISTTQFKSSKRDFIQTFFRFVVGIDTVDREFDDGPISALLPLPSEWNSESEPPYLLHSFLIFENILVYNSFADEGYKLRFCPHTAEAPKTAKLLVILALFNDFFSPIINLDGLKFTRF